MSKKDLKQQYKNSKNFSNDLKIEIRKRKALYNKATETKIKKQASFLKNLTTINHKTGECYNLEVSLEKSFAEDYFYLKQASFLLHKEEIDNNDKVAIFYTATLKSEYHIKSKNSINKNAYNLFENGGKIEKYSVEAGYKVLNDHNRQIYTQFKINRKHIKVKYITVFEPHSDYTTHLHAIYFINREYVNQFQAHLRRLNANNKELGTEKEIKKIIAVQKKVKKETKIINNAVKYLLKYVEKNFKKFDKTYYGWKTYNKIRVFRVSKVANINKTIYKTISKTMKLSVNNDNISYISKLYKVSNVYNTLDLYNKITKVEITTINANTEEEKTKILEAENAFAYVKIRRIKQKKKELVINENTFNKSFKNIFNDLKIKLSYNNFKSEKEKEFYILKIKKFQEKNELQEDFINFLNDIKYNNISKIVKNWQKNIIKEQEKIKLEDINIVLNTIKHYYYNQNRKKMLYISKELYFQYFYIFLGTKALEEKKYISYKITDFEIFDLWENSKEYDKRDFETIFDFTKEKIENKKV